MSEGGISSGLPEGWARVRLGDILARIEAGKSYQCEPRPASADEWGVIKVSAMTWGDFDEDENKAVPAGFPFNPDYEIRPGDILLSRANTAAYVGASVLVGKCRSQLLLSDKSLRLVPAEGIDRAWLAYLLSSPGVRGQISERATGTKDSMRNISQGVLADIECLLPPVEEQRRIVVALDEQISKMESAERLLACSSQRSSQYRTVVADWAVRGRLVDPIADERTGHELLSSVRSARAGRVKGRRLRPAPFSGLVPKIPDHWSMASLDEIASIIEYGSSVKTAESLASGAVPVLRMGNIQGGEINPSRLKYIPEQHPDVSKYMLEDGDLLFNRTNSFELVGKSAVYREELGRMIFASYLIRCRFFSGVDPDWVNLVINSPMGRRYIRSVATQQVGQANVNGSKLAAMPIPVPPECDQRRILDAVDAHNSAARRLESGVRQQRVKATLLRRSLLAEALAGRLVPQDPTDEPADALLARIHAERQATGVAKARRRSPRRTPAQRKRNPDTAPAPDAPPPPPADAPALTTATQPTLDLEISS